jgi:hypothetical protein
VTGGELTLISALTAVAVGAVAAWWRVRRPKEVLVVAEAEAALLASVATLRRLGARITRYDTDALTLEARTAAGDGHVLRVSAQPAGEGTTRLLIEADAGDGRQLVRRFRAELARGA